MPTPKLVSEIRYTKFMFQQTAKKIKSKPHPDDPNRYRYNGADHMLHELRSVGIKGKSK